MNNKSVRISVLLGSVALLALPAVAQQAAEPAPAGENIPPVDVVQKPKAAPKAAAKKAAPAKKKAVAKQTAPSEPTPQGPVDAEFAPADEAGPASDIARTYPSGGQGAAARAAIGTTGPIDPKRGIAPADLSNVAGSVSRATKENLEEQRPKDNHEALARIPGVTTVNDDGMARHSGIGIRGSAHRRSRKVLVMEDGVPINFSTYLDSSTHYTPPTQRVESIEVLRGPVVSYGPLNNHGIVNFRNLSPFGANETVVEAALGHTSGSDKNLNNYRHTHTRQNIGNVGVVASYSGGDAGGAWDVEKTGYNDFYGALGFKGSNQDLTISGGYHRQRDRYDEDNFQGSTAEFFSYRRNKKQAAATGTDLFAVDCCYEWSNYNADYYRLQVAHNYYFNQNTTLSTRIFGNDHERARFYVSEFDDPTDFTMEGRDRRYRNYGADSRIEFANLPFLGGMKQDVQAGIRYEEHFFDNKNREADNVRLNFNNRGPLDGAVQELEAQSFAAFVQTAIHITPRFTLTPGVRFESYDVSFNDPDSFDGSASYNHVLPMLAFSWNAAQNTTVYGGYHRGLTPHIVRDLLESDADVFVAPGEEVGDNFELGVRTTAVRGLTLDMAYFHKRIDNYQFGEAFQSDISGDRVFTSLDEVEFNGFELYSRLDSRPFTGSAWNLFGEGVYTYTDSKIRAGEVEPDVDGDPLIDVRGNDVPESMRHVANLTLGIEYLKRWDASLTWTHKGRYFTDARNIGKSEDADEGVVDDVWLLSARTNYHVNENLSLFVSGQNLTNEFYVADRSDGAKPGVGRTIWGGFKYKF